jgi:hypothetical protein
MGLVLYLQKFQRPPRRLQRPQPLLKSQRPRPQPLLKSQRPRPQPLLKSQRRPRLQPQLLKVVLAQQLQLLQLALHLEEVHKQQTHLLVETKRR